MPVLVPEARIFRTFGAFCRLLNARKELPFSYTTWANPCPRSNTWKEQDGVVIMGGPMSANDPLPGLADELALIQRAVEARIPLLGICLGAQLIAKALGARLSERLRGNRVETGHITEEDKPTPLFPGIPFALNFFHWHGETFMPSRAGSLAGLFRLVPASGLLSYAESVYGIQFHPEIPPEMIVDWCAQPANCGDVEGLKEPVDPHAADPGPLAERIFEVARNDRSANRTPSMIYSRSSEYAIKTVVHMAALPAGRYLVKNIHDEGGSPHTLGEDSSRTAHRSGFLHVRARTAPWVSSTTTGW